MPQEPKRRHSKARKRVRRAAISLQAAASINCKNCGKPKLPHIVCSHCGFYGGKEVTKTSKVVVTKA